MQYNEDGNIEFVEPKEDPPLDEYQVKYLQYLDRRRDVADKHRHEAPPVSFATFKQMLDDYKELSANEIEIMFAIQKILYAEKEDGLLRIR